MSKLVFAERTHTNLYRYANNDPLNNFDPSGNSWLSKAVRKLVNKVKRTINFVEFVVNNPDDFVDNLDEIGKGLVKDPMFWVTIASFAIGTPIFAGNITWGPFQINAGLNGVSFNWTKLATDSFQALTGGGVSFGLPTAGIATPIYSGQAPLFQSVSQIGLASQGSLSTKSPFRDSNFTLAAYDEEGISLDRYGNPLNTDREFHEYVSSHFNVFGAGEAPIDLGMTDFDALNWDSIAIPHKSEFLPHLALDPYALPQGGISAFSRMAYASNQGEAFEAVGQFAQGVATIGRGAADVGATVGSIFFEPLDWALTAREVYNEPTSLWSYAGVLPFVPASAGRIGKHAGKYADEAVDVYRGATSEVATASLRQLQKKFKHAGDFGIVGSPNTANIRKYYDAIQSHLNDPATRQIIGTYRGNPAIINVNPATGLGVIRKTDGAFVSGWKLSPDQMNHVLSSGKLGGG